MRTLAISAIIAAGAAFGATSAMAQDTSPVLLIETGANPNPQYRRVVYVKYLSGNAVTANYRAENRTEFKRIDTKTPQGLVDSCATGPATRLSDIIAFSRDEERRAKSGEAPETRSFCIKDVNNWTNRNRDVYLDPIFKGLPHSIQGL